MNGIPDIYLNNPRRRHIRCFPHSWLIIGFVTRFTRRMPLVEQELPTPSEHTSSPPVFSGVRVTRSLVLRVMFCRSLFVFLFFFCHCVVFSSIYGFWLPLWYLQTLRMTFWTERDVEEETSWPDFSCHVSRTSYI
jgi:hypothetical protein